MLVFSVIKLLYSFAFYFESILFNIISSKENSTSYNYLNSTFTSCQETRISDSEEDEIVYITNSGSCYHQEYCRYVKRSCIPIKLKDALKRGYKSCSRC